MSEPTADTVVQDPYALAHPQETYLMLRETSRVLDTGSAVVVAGDTEVRDVLKNPGVFSSGIDAAPIGQVRPLIPLQIDPPEHKRYRRLLDPLFAPKQVALLEDRTRALARDLIGAIASDGQCNFHDAVAGPLPTTVFLQLLGLPVERRDEFIALKDGIIRPPTSDPEKRKRMVDATGQQIYAVLDEVVAERTDHQQEDFVSGFLDAEVDGHRLTHDEILDICYLFFLAGLDTVTASLDCFIAFLAQQPDHRRQVVNDPACIPHAMEEMLRWDSPVTAVVRITTEATELSGCPIDAGTPIHVLLGSANTDDDSWTDAHTVDFDRSANKHLAFGGGAHRCLGSHLARMELRVVLEEWHNRVPDYAIAPGIELSYTQGIRSIENLELVWEVDA